jgi:hypothetical protein
MEMGLDQKKLSSKKMSLTERREYIRNKRLRRSVDAVNTANNSLFFKHYISQCTASGGSDKSHVSSRQNKDEADIEEDLPDDKPDFFITNPRLKESDLSSPSCESLPSYMSPAPADVPSLSSSFYPVSCEVSGSSELISPMGSTAGDSSLLAYSEEKEKSSALFATHLLRPVLQQVCRNCRF